MPWKECTMIDGRIDFIHAVLEGHRSIAAVCRDFGISRKTGYKWLNRYQAAESCTALFDQSRRPIVSPARVAEDIEQRVIELRKQRGWGAR